MEPEEHKNTPDEDTSSHDDQHAPADALSRTPEDLEQEELDKATDEIEAQEAKSTEKKPSKLRQFFRKVNVYFLGFFLLVVIAAAVAVVTYLNSQKVPEDPGVATQELSEESLQQLANSDASVGDSSQTLTIRGNTIISGQTLARGNLNVAGNLQTGGSLQAPNLTISGTSNLGTAQINTLQVANTLAVQGGTTMRDLNVAGTSTFGGAMTASQITTSRLVLSGNASLEVPNHISFTGPTPGRAIDGNALGGGGTASISGSDTAGTVNINTGNSPQAGCMVRLTFAQRFSKQPHVIISPVGNAAGRTQYYVDRDAAGFSICSASPAPGNQAFGFDYFVTF